MENKTKVKILNKDHQYNEYQEGEIGYIDGYCRAADNRPYAVVVINTRLVMIPFYNLEIIK
jgi:hypothetical protein